MFIKFLCSFIKSKESVFTSRLFILSPYKCHLSEQWLMLKDCYSNWISGLVTFAMHHILPVKLERCTLHIWFLLLFCCVIVYVLWSCHLMPSVLPRPTSLFLGSHFCLLVLFHLGPLKLNNSNSNSLYCTNHLIFSNGYTCGFTELSEENEKCRRVLRSLSPLYGNHLVLIECWEKDECNFHMDCNWI